MWLRNFSVFLVLISLVSCGDDTTRPPKADCPVKVNTPVDSSRKNTERATVLLSQRKTAYDVFVGRKGDSLYYCEYKGRVEIADTLGKNRRFLFDLEAEFLIDEIFIHRIDDQHFFVVWQETDHLGINSKWALYKLGTKKPEWIKSHGEPDPGQPVIDGDYAYVSTLGMIGKIDMRNGQYAWQHDSLYDPMKFKYKTFERPLIYPTLVCFFDKPIRGRKSNRDSIWVNDVTGKIGR
ncbi:MAG TPA: hypothetical protein VK826_00625 [Bacteroidia bacterium]|nr:hypothetical protein [Bacteroidia bacterium]